MSATGRTRYTEVIPGQRGNDDRSVRFDLTDGYLGVTAFQRVGSMSVSARVLLSPYQLAALLKFVRARRRATPAPGRPRTNDR